MYLEIEAQQDAFNKLQQQKIYDKSKQGPPKSTRSVISPIGGLLSPGAKEAALAAANKKKSDTANNIIRVLASDYLRHRRITRYFYRLYVFFLFLFLFELLGCLFFIFMGFFCVLCFFCFFCVTLGMWLLKETLWFPIVSRKKAKIICLVFDKLCETVSIFALSMTIQNKNTKRCVQTTWD